LVTSRADVPSPAPDPAFFFDGAIALNGWV
jgi:hypothetical protein